MEIQQVSVRISKDSFWSINKHREDAPIMLKCKSSVKPHSLYLSQTFFFFLNSFIDSQHDCNLQYMFNKGSERRENVSTQQISFPATWYYPRGEHMQVKDTSRHKMNVLYEAKHLQQQWGGTMLI